MPSSFSSCGDEDGGAGLSGYSCTTPSGKFVFRVRRHRHIVELSDITQLFKRRRNSSTQESSHFEKLRFLFWLIYLTSFRLNILTSQIDGEKNRMQYEDNACEKNV